MQRRLEEEISGINIHQKKGGVDWCDSMRWDGVGFGFGRQMVTEPARRRGRKKPRSRVNAANF